MIQVKSMNSKSMDSLPSRKSFEDSIRSHLLSLYEDEKITFLQYTWRLVSNGVKLF